MPPSFTVDDLQLFERYTPTRNYGPLPDADKRRFSSLRERVGQLKDLAIASDPRFSAWKSHLSVLNPSGNTPKDYWCALCPPGADNKSFAAQVALIVSARGAELCFCLGAGEAQIGDPEVRARNQQYFDNTQRNLARLPPELVDTLNNLDGRWSLKRTWRLPGAGDDFASVQDWLSFASTTPAASISTYLSPTEVVGIGDGILDLYIEVVRTFAPVLEWIDAVHPTDETRVLLQERQAPRTWVFAPGEGARLWEDFKRNGIVAIGWDELGDLSQYQDREDIAAAIRAHRGDAVEPVNDSLACWQFAREMAPGDVVYVKRGLSEIIGKGTVESAYSYNPNRVEYKNVRRMRWDLVGSWFLPDDNRVAVKTLTNVTRYSGLTAQLEQLVSGQLVPERATSIAYGLDDAIKDTFFTADEWTSITTTWSRKLNLVLQGPPGVGKTFIAKRLAYSMMGEKDPSRLLNVQFHQSYSYEEFVAGYRPDGTGLVLKPGLFKLFCEKARADRGRVYVVVIDEFNRANVSRVFGELMVLLEPDKRSAEHAMPLTYDRPADSAFWVPRNLLMLGLMNTADRSLAFVDYALRRRFAFVDLRPAFQKASFRDYLLQKGVDESVVTSAIAKLSALNDQIAKDDRNLGPGFQIGHSYFCPNGSEASLDSSWYAQIIETEILPLLNEYWPGQSERLEDASRLLRP